MAWLFRGLDRTARLLPLGAMLVALLAFRAGMQATLGRLREVSGESILDYEVFYSRERVIEVFAAYGVEGARLYRRFMTFDLGFPLIYSLFFASLIHVALGKTRWRVLALAPFVMALLDYVENGFFFWFLQAHPDIPQAAVAAANVFTLGKFGFGAVSAMAGVVAVVVFLRDRLRRG